MRREPPSNPEFQPAQDQPKRVIERGPPVSLPAHASVKTRAFWVAGEEVSDTPTRGLRSLSNFAPFVNRNHAHDVGRLRPMHLVNNRKRPGTHFIVDSSEILAQHAEAQQ